MKTALLLFIALLVSARGIAQVKKQRLIAEADYEYLGPDTGRWTPILHDSVYFTYSGSRHSLFDYNAMDYADLSNMYDNRFSLVDKAYRILVPNNIDSADNTLSIAFDSMYYFGHNGRLLPTQVAALRYYPDGMIMEAYNSSSISPPIARFIRYFGRLTLARHTSATNGFDRFFGYDFYGNLVVDSANTGQVYVYDFDSAGRYVASRGPKYRNYTYYSDGKVQTLRAGNQLDSFFYTPGVRGYTSKRTYSYTNGVLDTQASFRYSTHINALGQKDSIYHISQDSSIWTIAHLTYDAHGNPLTKTMDIYFIGSMGLRWVKHQTKYYHYEDYTPSLTAESLASGPSTISVFPNPTTGSLNMHFGSEVPKGWLRVNIFNASGQLMHAERINPNGRNASIGLSSAAAPGMYSISVLSTNNVVVYRGTFIKQ